MNMLKALNAKTQVINKLKKMEYMYMSIGIYTHIQIFNTVYFLIQFDEFVVKLKQSSFLIPGIDSNQHKNFFFLVLYEVP